MAARPIVRSLDHLVLTVRSVPNTITWYTRHLGMKHEIFRPPAAPNVERHALIFGTQKINLHQSGKEFEPKAQNVMPGSEDLCFLTDVGIGDVLEHFKREGIEVLENSQVVFRTGARGKLKSVYVRDPDGNLIEISNYATDKD